MKRLPLLAWLGLGLAALAVALFHAWRCVLEPDAARFSFDSAEYALAGRAWLETGRLVTPFVHPAALGVSPGPPFPLLVGHPLVPALDALAFALTRPDPLATLLPSVLAFVCAVLATTRLALGLSGSRAAALGAGVAFTLSPWALRFASEGLSEMPFAALLTAAFVLLWELPERPRPVALGLVLALAHLTRPVLVPILPALLLGVLALAPARRRVRTLATVLLAFAPLASLTALYKWAATGSPFTDVGGTLLLTGVTPEFVVSRLNRMVPAPDALAWLREHPGLYAAKLARNLKSVVWGAFWLGGRWPAAFATLATLAAIARGTPRARAFVLAVTGVAVLLTLLASATVADPRMLFPLLGVAFALAFAALARASETVARGRRELLLAAVVLASLANAWPLAREWRAAAAGSLAGRSEFHEREWRGLGLAAKPLLPAGVLVASDAAPWIAWHTGHPVTLVPLLPQGLQRGGRLAPGAVVLTNEWLVHRPGEEAWARLFDAREPPAGFAFAGHVRSGRLEAVVFTRISAP